MTPLISYIKYILELHSEKSSTFMDWVNNLLLKRTWMTILRVEDAKIGSVFALY